MTSLSVSASVIAGATSTTSTSGKLVKTANGEYTAASVSADPTDATKLALIKEKDGNYGTQAAQTASSSSKPPQVAPSPSASATSSASVQEALTGLTLGGT